MKTNILTLVITLVVGVIFAGSLLVPVITDAQKNLGDPITETNESAEYMSLSKGDVTLELDEGILTLNGSTLTLTGSERIIFSADVLTIWYDGSVYKGSWINAPTFTPGISNIIAFDISVTNDKLTCSVTYQGHDDPATLSDYSVKFAFYIDPVGEYAYFSPEDTQPYVTNIKDVYCTGSFYTGTNKTNYWYFDGEAGGIVAGYTYNFDADLTPVNGTTDIYTLSNAEFSISDESFTPFYMIVKKTIDGHATSGSVYSLLDSIPVLVIVALVMIAIGAIAYNRRD